MNPSITDRLQSLGWEWKGGVLTPPEPSPTLKEHHCHLGSRYALEDNNSGAVCGAVIRVSKDRAIERMECWPDWVGG